MTDKKHLMSLLIVGVLVVGMIVPTTMSLNKAYAFTNLSANPSSGIGFKGTQYVVIGNVATSGTVGKILVTFPTGTTLTALSNFAVVTVNDVVVPGTTATVNTAGTTMEFDLTTPQSLSVGEKIFIFIEKIRNPSVTAATNLSVQLETQTSTGVLIDGPTSANVGYQPISMEGSLALTGNSLGTGAAEDLPVTVPGTVAGDPVVCSLQGSQDGLVVESAAATGANSVVARVLSILGSASTTGATVNCMSGIISGQ